MKRTRIYWKGILKITVFLCVLGIAGYVLCQASNLRAESATSKEITAEIQKIKDAGEPTTIEELVPPDIPDGENGALVYNQAFNLLKELEGRYKEEWKYVPYEGKVKWNEAPEAAKEKVKDLLLKNPDFMRFYQLLEKASEMKCRFLERKDYEKGAAMLLPHLASMRSCIRLLAARVDLQTEQGKIDNALHDCLIGLKMSGSLSKEPILISGLVRIAMDNIILDRTKDIMKKGEAKTEAYLVLIKEIIREREDRMLYQGFQGERTIFGMVEFPRLKSGIKEKRDLKPLIELFYEKEKERIAAAVRKDPVAVVGWLEENELAYLRLMAKWVALSKLPYLETREKAAGLEKELLELPDEKAALVKFLMSALSNLFIKEARLDARLGNTEIALACHLYKAKHNDYPTSLKELSPESLSGLPRDPFTEKDYIYRKKDKGFIVYSVGDNLKDDGGVSQNIKKWSGDYDIIWEE